MSWYGLYSNATQNIQILQFCIKSFITKSFTKGFKTRICQKTHFKYKLFIIVLTDRISQMNDEQGFVHLWEHMINQRIIPGQADEPEKAAQETNPIHLTIKYTKYLTSAKVNTFEENKALLGICK